MNNKKTITICAIVADIILALIILITLMNDITGIAIVFSALFIILTICLGIYLREEPDEFTAFVKERKRILRVYDSVIVEVEDIPNIAGKNIIKVKTIDDLVDAQLELREPIYYKNDNDSCFFLLLHYNEACIYILKMNDSVVSPTEQSIKYMKADEPQVSENILEKLEKTVVYKLDGKKSVKISPVKTEEKIEIVDDTAIKEDLDSHKREHITKEAIETEISKTMYIKDLKEKIKVLEQQKAKEARMSKKEEEQKAAKKARQVKKTQAKKAAQKDTHSNRRADNFSKTKKK